MMEKDRNQKVSDRLNDFIAAHRKAILAVLIVLVAAVIALCVALVLVQRSVETRFNALNDLEAQYATLSVMDKTSAEYEEAAADFKAAAESVAADGLDSYTGAKAQYLLADLAFAEGEWDTAAAYYADIAAAQSETYLAPLALMNEAACYENSGDSQAALDLYSQVVDTYGENGVFAPKAMFAIGRLYAAMGEMELAEAEFETLTGLYLAPESGTPSEYARMADAYLINFAE